MNHATDNKSLGDLIHQLRKHKKMSLTELANHISRSVGFLSQVERGLSQPTVEDLTAISEALDTPTTYFYATESNQALDWVTRPEERRTLYFAQGITDVLISPTMKGAFNMLETTMEPGASSGERHMRDRSEQGGYIIEGQLTIWHEDASTVLKQGDAFQVNSYANFKYANEGTTPTRILWVYN
ncbi:MAG: helix-turn-helix transcriptional regulator [Gammaproteobacteria bacterium]|nr:helix-turn-helix transcriptional regulator [Gammaproteobacteria bacterium]